jgi:hypothetical protein
MEKRTANDVIAEIEEEKRQDALADLESAVVEAAIKWREADIAYDNAGSKIAEDKVAVSTAGVEMELADAVDRLLAEREGHG